ncbi:hypothetical protein AB0I28_19080 [Phytomonospora sp. NPDC050363]|uniref:hypothetical protein n=1 Tax=Phytomonospora sp. NPDC050363 TaxID=3155642 RepID=UPI0033C7CCE8
MPRLLLLIAVVLGLGWMHTIGHHGGGHAPVAHGGADHVVHEPAEPTGASPTLAAPAPSPAVSVEMCLAVLTAAVLVVALLAVRVRRADLAARRRRTPAAAGHGPPRLIPRGLVIAELTVLRI